MLSFGLCNAPATFQQLADKVFQGMKWKEVLLYLDDIIVFSKTEEEHVRRLEKVFKRLRQAGLTQRPEKCQYMKKKVKLLGYIVNKNGLSPDDTKMKAIQEFPKPKVIKDVQSFIGLCNYYRKLIKNFAKIARPLHKLTKKDYTFAWENEQQEAFEMLKQKLTTAPALQHYDSNKGSELRVDACSTGIGAVLLQEGIDTQLHPIAYVSRGLSKAEQNYTITELEGLAA